MDRFPDRCLDVGIAEGHAVTFCGGIAHNRKLKVICSIYATFLQRAFDNLFHDICLQEIPVVFAIDRGGISAADGSTHHGIYDISFLQAMPNMVICQPRNGQLLKELLQSSFSWDRPVAIRYPNMGTEESSLELRTRPLGVGEVLVEGSELMIIGLGYMSLVACGVQEKLKGHGIKATVVDPIFVKPLDSELLLRLLSSHTHVVTLEEHSLHGGLGSALNSFIAQNHLSSLQILNIGIPDTFLEQGSHLEVLSEVGLAPDQIYEKILQEFSSLTSSLVGST